MHSAATALDWADGCGLRFVGSSLTRLLVFNAHCLIWAKGMLLLTETSISESWTTDTPQSLRLLQLAAGACVQRSIT